MHTAEPDVDARGVAVPGNDAAADATAAPLAARVKATPITRAERSLAPDLARGFMLLFIALANVPLYLWGRALGDDGMIEGSSPASRATHMVLEVLVNERSRPMFAILYGFGLAMIATRLHDKATAAGHAPERASSMARRLLARRSLWLMVFGLVHASLLFFGDILGSYGVTGLVALAFVLASPRKLKVAFWVSTAWVTLIGGPALILISSFDSTEGDVPAPNGPSYVDTLITGPLSLGADLLVAGVLGLFVPLVLGGVMLFRAGWLTAPAEHLRELKVTATWGIGAGIVTALPIVLSQLFGWEGNAVAEVVVTLAYLAGGSVAGLGYICLFALIAHRLRDYGRRGLVRAIAALGERSLTGYLMQSMICAPLLSVWGFNLAEDRGYGFAVAFALATWAVTVAVAYALDRAGKKGPFEILLRRLSYR